MTPARKKRSAEEPETISRWEWVTGAAGLLMVLFIVVVLLRDVARPNGAPELTVRVDSVVRQAAGHLAHITVRNSGSEAASGVAVDGALTLEGGRIENSGIVFDNLPSRASRSGGLLFQDDPGRGQLRVHVSGYTSP